MAFAGASASPDREQPMIAYLDDSSVVIVTFDDEDGKWCAEFENGDKGRRFIAKTDCKWACARDAQAFILGWFVAKGN